MFSEFNRNQKLFFLIATIIVIAYLLLHNFGPEFLFKNENYFSKGINLFKETSDLRHYWNAEIGWLKDKSLNFFEGNNSYPQLALIILAAPLLVVSNLNQYYSAFPWLSGIALVLLIFFSIKIVNLIGSRSKLYFLFLTPAFLYFCLNRFDIFPALFLQISIYYLLRKKAVASWLWLAVAVMTKWYAILLFPLYLILTQKEGYEIKIVKKVFSVFIGVIFLPLIISFILIGREIFYPYFFHLDRSLEPGNWTYILFENVFKTNLLFKKLMAIFLLILQFSLPVYILFKATKFIGWLKTHRDKIIIFALVIINFIFWSKYYSPQWQVWLWPLLILIGDRKIILPLIFYDLVNYLQFPIILNIFGPLSSYYLLIALLRNALLLLIVYQLVKYLKITFRHEDRSYNSNL